MEIRFTEIKADELHPDILHNFNRYQYVENDWYPDENGGYFLVHFSRITDDVEQAVRDANVALTSANGKNKNFYGPDTPINPRIGDLWFKENGENIEI